MTEANSSSLRDKFEQRICKEIVELRQKGVGGLANREMYRVFVLHTTGLV